jgi:NADH:ubiquinone reductase (non-electrogenic)
MSHLLTDEYLCVLGTKNIFSIGDCATIKDQELPETAQVAQQQGTYLANALNRKAKDQIVSPFSYRYMGMLAYIGRRRALADFKNMKLKGLIIWIFWRAIYLTKLVSRKNKILVIFDWFKTSLFGRDISRF